MASEAKSHGAKEKQRQAAIPAPKIAEQDKVSMFSISGNDPFVDGVARFAVRAGAKTDTVARPLVLRADDPAAVDCLKNYRLRANGAGDTIRTAIADEAIVKFGGKIGK